MDGYAEFVLLALITTAGALSGTYVGAETGLLMPAAEVVASHVDGRVTLTMAAVYDGSASEFVLLIPVPEVEVRDSLRVLEPGVFDRLRRDTAPDLLVYNCQMLYPPIPPEPEEKHWYNSCGYSLEETGDTEGPYDTGPFDEVLEDRFTVGEYEVVALSEAESRRILTWLEDRGLAVDDAQADAIQAYVDEGHQFVVVGVHSESAIPELLSPLQWSYDADEVVLPVRLGAASSPGTQDLVLYTLTTEAEGRAEPANYAQASGGAECMAAPDAEMDFDGWYEEYLQTTFGEDGGWVFEHGWLFEAEGPARFECPPECGSEVLLSPSDFAALGAARPWRTYVSRMRLRGTPEQLAEDLRLELTGRSANRAVRFVAYDPALEAEWPYCDSGWHDEPELCSELGADMAARVAHWSDAEPAPESCACTTPARATALPVLACAVLFALRRRD